MTLLVLAIAGLTSGIALSSGFLPVGDSPVWFVCLPTGAIFFGLFLISITLEGAVAEYDRENHSALGTGAKNSGSSSAASHDSNAKKAGGTVQFAASGH